MEKIVKCIDCGKDIKIGLRASTHNCRCEECKSKHHKPSDLRYCKICGRSYFKYEGGCNNDFCKKHGIEQFKTLIKYFTFNENKLGTQDVENEFYRVRNLIYDLYWNDQLSTDDIGKLFGYTNSHNIAQSIFKYLNIPTRNIKEATKAAYLQGKISNYGKNQYEQQWHTAWDGNEVYLRSSYEFDYANKLDKQHIKYEVENLRIKYFDTQRNEYRCAIPDFYIPSTNTIVEIKSNYTLDVQNMKDKINAYKKMGYNTILLVEHKEVNIFDY